MGDVLGRRARGRGVGKSGSGVDMAPGNRGTCCGRQGRRTVLGRAVGPRRVIRRRGYDAGHLRCRGARRGRGGVSVTEQQGLRQSAALSPLPRARLDDLLSELLARVGEVLDTQDRLRGLLDAVVGIASDLDLDSVLERIVRAACQLADARYGALGVLRPGPDRRLREFVTHGLTDEQRARIGDLPRGHGILGVIIDSPEPLRLNTLGDHPRSFGFPPNHPPMSTFLGVPIRIRDKVFGNLYLTEKQSGDGFTTDDEEIVVGLAAAAGVVIENARLYKEAARRERWLEAAAEITAALLGAVRRDEALGLVADRAREVAGADVAAVLLRHQDGRLLVEVTSGPLPDDAAGTEVPTVGTVAGAVLHIGETVVLEDA